MLPACHGSATRRRDWYELGIVISSDGLSVSDLPLDLVFPNLAIHGDAFHDRKLLPSCQRKASSI